VVLFNQAEDSNLQGIFESEYIIEPWYHFERWDEASLGEGEAIETNLVLDAGYHFIEINYDAPINATGCFRLTINNSILGLRKVYPGTNAVYSWEVNTKVRRNHILKLELINEKDKDGKEIPVKPVKITNLITYGSRDELFKHLLQTRIRSRLLDSGIGENPLGIKNKISIEEDTLNVLLASPHSEFTFDVLVPENAALQFGCGLAPQARDLNGDGVEFSILLQDESGEKNELFHQVLDPFHNQDQGLKEERIIDLSGYSGQNVVMRFITSTPDQLNFQNDVSYWINPLIYQRSGRSIRRNGKPNVILISLDTLRADHLGSYGYNRKTSPNIDLLAKDGILFDRCFSQASYTLPSHVSMLTGLNPVKHNVFSSVLHRLDPAMITLADRLREKGYLTAAVTGGGIMGSFYGFPKGFDSYNERLTRIQGTTAQKIGELAVSWLEENGDKPFFLFLHTYQIHGPFLPPPPYKSSFLDPDEAEINSRKLNDLIGDAYRNYFVPLTDQQRKNLVALYDAEILYTDEVMLKPIFKSLKDQGLYNDTMIIVTADHGEEFYDHGGWMHGHTLYNELINVPLIIKLPHGRFSGTTFENIVRSIDILPTILEELGIGLVQSEIDGKSLIKIIQGKEKEDRVFFSEIKYASFFPDQIASNTGDFKMLLNKTYTDTQYNYFSTPPPSRKDIELYDLFPRLWKA
jgi:arylsulfatase A-like enzyme